MSAYGCCGEYNEHSPRCPVILLQQAEVEISRLKEALTQSNAHLEETHHEMLKLQDALEAVRDAFCAVIVDAIPCGDSTNDFLITNFSMSKLRDARNCMVAILGEEKK